MPRAGMTSSRKPLSVRSHSLRLWKLGAALVVIVAWAYLFILGDGGWLDLQARRDQLSELEFEVGRLEAVNDSLRTVLNRLENDPEYVEKVAREKYGMVRSGERLYRIRTTASESTDSQ